MQLIIFQILAFTFFISRSLARDSRLFKRTSNVIAPQAVEDPVEMTKRDDTKYVIMHIIVGNTYQYTDEDWQTDIRQIQAKNVDAIALNIGKDVWEPAQAAKAYAAVEAINNLNIPKLKPVKAYFSPDFSSMNCTLSTIVSLINQYANHPSQFKVNGKPMISSYEGGCLGNTGWESLKTQTNGYIMPFISGLEGSFSEWTALDSWYCWGCAWPKIGQNLSTADDIYYLNQLGDKYATTVSGWMFTHFSDKNFFQSDGDWLINARWEELISLRDKLTFVQINTWNDFGESDYFGRITSIGNEAWVEDFPHTAWFDMSQYYITAFKTGSYPAISSDVIYFWARPHPANATATSDPLPKPSGYQYAMDTMWAVAFATSKANVTLKCGSSSATFAVSPGVNKLKIPLAPGGMSVKMVRNGQIIVQAEAINYTYSESPPLTYNYNAWVGSATASTTIQST